MRYGVFATEGQEAIKRLRFETSAIEDLDIAREASETRNAGMLR